jgi:hypothetical protein
VKGSIAVGTGVHGAGDSLSENAALCHGMSANDVGLIEVGPAGNFCAERMGQVNKYGFSHFKVPPKILCL